jgi:hypothetical protein
LIDPASYLIQFHILSGIRQFVFDSYNRKDYPMQCAVGFSEFPISSCQENLAFTTRFMIDMVKAY